MSDARTSGPASIPLDFYVGRRVRFTLQRAYGEPVWWYGRVVRGIDDKVVVNHNGIDYTVALNRVEPADV